MARNGDSLKYQGRNKLNDMINNGKGSGESKRECLDGWSLTRDGIIGSNIEDKIFTDGVLKQYKRDYQRNFVPWAKEHHPEVKDIKEFRDPKYGREYVEYLKDKYTSPSTIGTYYAAAAKVCGWSRVDVDNLPKRTRSEIKNSRAPVNSDAHYNPMNHEDLEFICSHVGFRKKEMERVTGSDLIKDDDGYKVHIKGKGGKIRDSLIAGTEEEVQKVKEIFESAGEEKVLATIEQGRQHLPCGMNDHALRGKYACTMYKQYLGIDTAEIDHAKDLPRDKRVDCRKDYSGISLSRDAVQYVTENLGHNSNNEPVGHYLYGIVHEMRSNAKSIEGKTNKQK